MLCKIQYIKFLHWAWWLTEALEAEVGDRQPHDAETSLGNKGKF